MRPRSKRIAIALVLLLAVGGLTSFVLLRPRVDDPRLVGTWSILSDSHLPGLADNQAFILKPDGKWEGRIIDVINIDSPEESIWRVRGETLQLIQRRRFRSALDRLIEGLTDLVLRRDSDIIVFEFQLKPTAEEDFELLEISRSPPISFNPGALVNVSPPLRLVRWKPVNTAHSE